jgi:membrane-associated protease RseP (regulator of RpoE activity)
VAGRVAGRGGFDSHPLPPLIKNLYLPILFYLWQVNHHSQDINGMETNESTTHQTDIYKSLISRFMQIEDTTLGDTRQGFLIRFRGNIYNYTPETYDQVAEALKPYQVTPLFRIEDSRHSIILIDGVIQPKPSNPWINLGLFILTIFSVLLAGTIYGYSGPLPDNLPEMLITLSKNILVGWPFALSMLGILVAHEFGHYLAARHHKTAVTLPYFLPFPFSAFGTMGAFIQLKQPPKNKNILLDIGVAGPLAGLVIAIPVLIYGLSTSQVHRLPQVLPPGQGFEGNSILYLILKYAVHGKLLPQPAGYGGTIPVLYWIRYFFTGMPLPRGGFDVTINQIAWAGWAGLLVTALNLIPAGQLDGGHLLYVLIGRKARKLLPIMIIVIAILGIFWMGWWIWAALLFFLGRTNAEPLDQIAPLEPRRKAIAILGLIIFVLVFTPVPLISVLGG